MKNRISVIVPVYNVELYLEQCIDSILNQTYTNIEILLIDDGSTDSSGTICEKYSKKYDNVKTFHKENGGLMSAWKYGVEYASGQYIGFVDSDDWIDEDMYETLLDAILSANADISVCGLIKGEYILTQPSDFNGIMQVEEVYPKLINNGNFMGRGVIPSRVVKLFNKSVVEKTLSYCINDITLGEDMTMNFAAFMFAKRVVFLNDFFPYHYRVNLESITQKFNSNIFEKAMLFENQLLLIGEKEDKFDFSKQIEADLLSNAINIIERICHSTLIYKEKKEYISRILADIRVVTAVENINYSKWEKRYKIYCNLLKKASINGILLYGKFIYIFRKIKIVIRKIRCD